MHAAAHVFNPGSGEGGGQSTPAAASTKARALAHSSKLFKPAVRQHAHKASWGTSWCMAAHLREVAVLVYVFGRLVPDERGEQTWSAARELE